jgi:tRNA (guanine-N7-)-methyltransferase
MTLGQKPHGPLRSYGRIKARQIKARQADLLTTRLPRISLDLSAPVDPQALRPDATETWLEIGFGGGEHMAAQAARRPDVLLIGAEPFLNGVAAALSHIEAQGLQNIRLFQGDARDLLAALPDSCLARVFVLFPDPWPKARHHKRRLINAEVLAQIVRVLQPGGRLRFSTDWADYAAWTLERALKTPGLTWTAQHADDWRTPPGDHVTTRYEDKRLGDCAPVFLEFERV